MFPGIASSFTAVNLCKPLIINARVRGLRLKIRVQGVQTTIRMRHIES